MNITLSNLDLLDDVAVAFHVLSQLARDAPMNRMKERTKLRHFHECIHRLFSRVGMADTGTSVSVRTLSILSGVL